jgi:LPXTG cell wall anchor motif
MKEFVKSAFDLCVDILNVLARLTGTTYEEINVIIFVIVGPLMFLGLLFLYLRKKHQYKKLKRAFEEVK